MTDYMQNFGAVLKSTILFLYIWRVLKFNIINILRTMDKLRRLTRLIFHANSTIRVRETVSFTEWATTQRRHLSLTSLSYGNYFQWITTMSGLSRSDITTADCSIPCLSEKEIKRASHSILNCETEHVKAMWIFKFKMAAHTY